MIKMQYKGMFVGSVYYLKRWPGTNYECQVLFRYLGYNNLEGFCPQVEFLRISRNSELGYSRDNVPEAFLDTALEESYFITYSDTTLKDFPPAYE